MIKLPRISGVKHLGEYRLHLWFTNGEQGMIDLRNDIVGAGGTFAPLENLDFFAKVGMSKETIIWPNGVEFDPIALYIDTIHPGQGVTFADLVAMPA